MKSLNTIKRGAKLTASLLTAGLLAACTGNFEEYNTNPYGPTPEDMLGDNAITNSLIEYDARSGSRTTEQFADD